MTVAPFPAPPSPAATSASSEAPTTIWCVIEDLHRDTHAADDVLEGRFTNAGETLTLGPAPDWNSVPHPDREWAIEWSKFYVGLDLAHAHHHASHDRYFRAWIDLVLSWIDQRPPDADTSDVTARRVQNWIYARAAFDQSPRRARLEGAEATAVAASIADQIDHIRQTLTPERNHRTLELYALFVAALDRRTRGEAHEELLSFAVHELYRNLCVDLLPDGVHRELSTHYHAIVLRSFLGARINADRFGISLPDGYDERLTDGFAFLADVLRPDGSLPMLGDSDDGDHRPLLRLAGEVLDRPDFVYVASAGTAGRPPAVTVSSYPHGGYHVVRSGWGTERPFEAEHHLVFDAGPLGPSGHAHYDALHLELTVSGRPLLVDPGRFTYAEGTGDVNWRHWFKGTGAHNTVTVDGADQTPYRAGKPKPPVAHARLIDKAVTSTHVELIGEVVSPCYDAVHTRRVVSIEDRWWLIEDTLDSHDHHDYELRFHLAPACGVHTVIDDTTAGRVTTMGADLLVLPTAPDAAGPTLDEGWTAPEYGRREPAPVVVARQSGRGRVRWLSAVVPHGLATRTRLAADTAGVVLHSPAGALWRVELTGRRAEVERA